VWKQVAIGLGMCVVQTLAIGDCPADCDKKCCTEVLHVRACEPTCQTACAAANLLCGKPTLPPIVPPVLAPLLPGVTRTVEKLGNDTLITLQKAGGDTILTLQKAGGDTIETVVKAGGDSVTTIAKAAGDTTATYIKGWRDSADQAQRSFKDTVDAGQAAVHYTENQLKSQRTAIENANKRLRDGKVVDAMWGLATEPMQSTEKNFAQATQESTVINTAAGSAAAIYGGPAGAAAYAAWATYRRTGNADLAFRAGILAAVTSQMGSSVASMPAGTTGEILKKAAMAGAAGGISVAAAGGDEQSIKEGFLKSAGAVLIQGGSNQLKAYSPKLKDAYDTVQCISARDVDCLSNTTWARNAKGKILYDQQGKPRIDPTKLDPKQYLGKWTGLDPNSVEGKKNEFITRISKLPKSAVIPLMKNQWVLTSALGVDEMIGHDKPTVVLTYVGKSAPFISTVKYGRAVTAASVAAPGTGAYVCPFNGFNRTVTVRKSGTSCEALYHKEGGVSETIWHSAHSPEICADKGSAFVKHLGDLGIMCKAR
jgi:hypothetical protein